MNCKNHPMAKAKRRCFFCKACICPRCQQRHHRHLFCSTECAASWQESTDRQAFGTVAVEKQLEQVLDITDAALEKNRQAMEVTLYERLTKQSSTLLQEIHELKHELLAQSRNLVANLPSPTKGGDLQTALDQTSIA